MFCAKCGNELLKNNIYIFCYKCRTKIIKEIKKVNSDTDQTQVKEETNFVMKKITKMRHG